MTAHFFRLSVPGALICIAAAMSCSNNPGPSVDPDTTIIITSDAGGSDATGDGLGEVDPDADGTEPDSDHVGDMEPGGNEVGDSDDAGIDPRWAPVQTELETSFENNTFGVGGMTLIVYNAADERVFESTVGDFDPDRRVAIASASKLVSGLVLMRLIADPSVNLAINTTVGEVLDEWVSEHGLINLDQLGAFMSGLPGEALCLRQPGITLADCVSQLSSATLSDAPGSDFSYGGTHLHVAARMAEVATGKSWQVLFDEQIATPLGIADSELRYVTLPRLDSGTTNPLIAGGLRATANEYVHFLRLLFHQGTVGGVELIPAADMQRFRQNLYINADIVYSPLTGTGYDFRYGWASWLECEGAVASCDVVASPGAFGFTPWVDYGNGYYAVLAMEAPEAGAGIRASAIAQRLKPLIVDALQ